MNNKILKSLVLLSIITIMFFIKIDNVKADELASDCEYYSPMTFLSKSGRMGIYWLSINDKIDGESHTYDLLGFCLKDNKVYVEAGYYNPVDGAKVASTIIKRKFFYAPYTKKVDKDEKYVFAFKDSIANNGALTLGPANEDGYKQYLTSVNNSKFTPGKGRLYDFIQVNSLEYTTLGGISAESEDWIVTKALANYMTPKRNTKILYDPNGNLFKNLPTTLVFVRNDGTPQYPTDEWKYFQEMCDTANTEGNFDCDKAKEGLKVALDIGETDTRVFTKAYYDATKSGWKNFMNTTNDKASNIKTGVFRYWFDNVGRYAFEDTGSAPFKLYWNYMCDNNAYTLTSDSCEAVNGFLDGKTTYKNESAYKKELEKDPCMAAFAPQCLKGSSISKYNGTACDSQKKTGAYINCKNCIAKSKTKGDTSTQQAYAKQCMGEDNYNKYIEAYNSQIEDYDTQIKDAAVKGINSAMNLYNLRVANAPTLNLSFNGHYDVDCDDFKVLKTIYNIFTIMAPVLVILFGSIDYTKAVIASDEEKRRKAQKKFVPRIIAAVLLILIPIVIRLILSFAGLDDSALSCIVN